MEHFLDGSKCFGIIPGTEEISDKTSDECDSKKRRNDTTAV